MPFAHLRLKRRRFLIGDASRENRLNAVDMTRREFLKDGLSALGFLVLPGGLFAAPLGWKPKKKPNLVVGILSDTHLQSGWDGVKPHRGFPLTYVTNAMKLFQERNIDAFMHLGDMAHRGKNVEVQYHCDIFEKFFPHGRAKDGHTVEKLIVCGNHELFGDARGGAGAWAPNIWKDKAERDKHTLVGDLPGHWEAVLGEKYEPVWHKVVKGYHFFGRHWLTPETKLAELVNAKAEECSLKGTKPFFLLSHARNHFKCRAAMKAFPNAIAFFGHWHQSNADWKTIYHSDKLFPEICCGACRNDGQNTLDANGNTLKEPDESDRHNWHDNKVKSRQAMVMNVYDDMVVFERHEVGQGGKLGADWVMPLDWGTGNGERGTGRKVHPFTRGELLKVIGNPEFPPRAKLDVKLLSPQGDLEARSSGGRSKKSPSLQNSKTPSSESKVLRITIPLADGNPDSRVFAYDVVVLGDDVKARFFKSVYYEGCNLGVGHEPGKGVTIVDIPQSQLPAGKKITIAVRPVSSLGTKGKTIGTAVRA